MVTVLVVIAMALSFSLGAYTGVKSIQMGLRYQMQIAKGVEPVLSPVKDVFERMDAEREVKKVNNVTSEMISDLFGV